MILSVSNSNFVLKVIYKKFIDLFSKYIWLFNKDFDIKLSIHNLFMIKKKRPQSQRMEVSDEKLQQYYF
jgi:hypothetical protein